MLTVELDYSWGDHLIGPESESLGLRVIRFSKVKFNEFLFLTEKYEDSRKNELYSLVWHRDQ